MRDAAAASTDPSMPWIDPAFQMLVATSSLWAPSDQAPGELRDGAHARPIVIGKLAVTSGVAMVKCTPPPAERGTAAREEVDLRVGRRSNVDLDAPPTRLNHGRGIVAGYGDCEAEGSCVRADRPILRQRRHQQGHCRYARGRRCRSRTRRIVSATRCLDYGRNTDRISIEATSPTASR